MILKYKDDLWRNILKTSSVRPSIVTDKRLLKSTKSIKFEEIKENFPPPPPKKKN